ncbi:MAG: metal-dependent hydrolase YbeY [Segetibacter sp.]|nr:metal-dependent hydrolase YbeY [Segetibacter sp.]
MPIIRFNYADTNPISLKGKKEVKGFIVDVFKLEAKALKELNYIFCSDQYLLEINKSYLQHDYFTDIITFDLSDGDETVGEIYISIDRVRENSISHSTKYTEEMLRVILHGALHLIGYKDKKKSEITIMRDKEEYYLRLFEAK